MIKKKVYTKKKESKVWYLNSKLTFGKHKGLTIKEVLEDRDTRSYVTDFMIGQLHLVVIGVKSVRTKKDSCWGIDLWKGLGHNHVFYRDYIISKTPERIVRIACKMTGVIVEGNTLEEAEDKLNMILDELYTDI